jgi:hypothetical protein
VKRLHIRSDFAGYIERKFLLAPSEACALKSLCDRLLPARVREPEFARSRFVADEKAK